MSRRARFAYGVTGVFLVVFCFFAVALIGLGVLVAVGAERIVAVQQAGSATGYYVTGGVLALTGLWMGRLALRDVGAVASVDVADDGTWILRTRLGRTVDTVPPGAPRRFELEGKTVIIAKAVPRRQEVVEGVLALPERERTHRLATSGPQSYDRALAVLGCDRPAPRPGEHTVIE